MGPYWRFGRPEVSAGEHAYLSVEVSRIGRTRGAIAPRSFSASAAGDARKIMPARTFELTRWTRSRAR